MASSILPLFPPLHSGYRTKSLFLSHPLQYHSSNDPFIMLPGSPINRATLKAAKLGVVGFEGRISNLVRGNSLVPMGGDGNPGCAPKMERIEYCETFDEDARNTSGRVIRFGEGEEDIPDGQGSKPLDSLENGGKYSETGYNDLLRWNGKGGKETTDSLNKFLIELMGLGKLGTMVYLFNEFQSRRLLPDAFSFSLMIQCFCKRNEPDNAKILLDEMLRNEFLPNISSFNILIDCYCKRGRVHQAQDVFKLMEEIGCEPETRTYNCLLNGLCYVGRVEEAFQLLMKMKYPPGKFDIYSFTTVMDGFCKVGRTNDALELFEYALNMGLKPTVATYNVILKGYCNEGRSLDGLGFLNVMEENKCQPDSICYKTLLKGLVKWRETHAALQIYKKMIQLGFEVDERATNTLLRGVCRELVAGKRQLTEVEDLVGFLNGKGYTISPYTYCLLVEAFSHGGEIHKALDKLLDMVNKGYSPRIMTYNVILRVLCMKGKTDDAMLVFAVMMISGATPSTFSYTILINELNRKQRFLDACGVYALALKRGVVAKHKPKKKYVLSQKGSVE